MNRMFIPIALALVSLSGCMQQTAATRTTETGTGSAANLPLQQRLADTRLNLVEADADEPLPMVMRLRADGTSETSMGGIVLTAQWQAEDDTLCQTDIRLGGMPSDDTAPQCVRVSVAGDQITLTGDADDGPRTFTGTITPL